METNLVQIKNEVNLQLSDKEVAKELINTTFKGLTEPAMKQAIMEGMMRGFKFENFLQKDIYAIPYSNSYSLVTSIDYARKIGMRSGVVGKSAPSYEVSEDGKVISCTVTIKKKVGETIGDFTETVYFSEYTTGRNLWTTKPRTMIAKVAEMHALRMACPEELSQAYVEEEMVGEVEKVKVNIDEYELKLVNAESLEQLGKVWSAMPVEAKTALEPLKNELKAKYENSIIR